MWWNRTGSLPVADLGARGTPPGSKFFQFHAVFGKILAPPPQGNPWSVTVYSMNTMRQITHLLHCYCKIIQNLLLINCWKAIKTFIQKKKKLSLEVDTYVKGSRLLSYRKDTWLRTVCCLQIIWWENRISQQRSWSATIPHRQDMVQAGCD